MTSSFRIAPLLLFVFLLIAVGCDATRSDSDTSSSPDALTSRAAPEEGAVFVLSNDATTNEVLVFHRSVSGRLAYAASFPTQGIGSGDGLNGTSNPLIVSDDDEYLYAVNGGSDDITAFHIRGTSLSVTSTIPSGGLRPISVTTWGDLVYVLNAGRGGSAGNVTGFRSDDGTLMPIPGATQPLNPNAGSPSQIDFSADGRLLIITDKPTNTITTYAVDAAGVAGAPQPQASSGQTPFGFDTNGSLLLVSEAFGGATDASALSTYRLNGDGSLGLISASIPTTESAACWAEITADGRYVYLTNTGSGTITGYRVGADGQVTRLDDDGVTATTGGGPLDVEMVGSRFLYVHVNGTNELRGFRVVPGNGRLISVDGTGADSLPATALGVAVTGA